LGIVELREIEEFEDRQVLRVLRKAVEKVLAKAPLDGAIRPNGLSLHCVRNKPAQLAGGLREEFEITVAQDCRVEAVQKEVSGTPAGDKVGGEVAGFNQEMAIEFAFQVRGAIAGCEEEELV
jgi:hypothetical protein